MSLTSDEEFKAVLSKLALLAYDNDLDQMDAQIQENMAWRIEACRATLKEMELKFAGGDREALVADLKRSFEAVVRSLEQNGYLHRPSETPLSDDKEGPV